MQFEVCKVELIFAAAKLKMLISDKRKSIKILQELAESEPKDYLKHQTRQRMYMQFCFKLETSSVETLCLLNYTYGYITVIERRM